ncbi:MAG: Flp pilus assembly complex ATPase component TadA, partial [Oscillospiraceae bacterium]|nr:Flp pilus assembly complex ATPase component TadA [Oscillospiraceae bacterium]
MAYMRLGELLVAAGAISQEELERGLELQKGGKDRLGDVLIKNNIISEDELIQALQMQLGIEFIDLTKVNIPTELASLLPKNIAKQYQVVPVRVIKDELYLAMSDPLNFYAIEEVRKAVRRKVVPMVATKAAIAHSIQVLYGNEGAARAIEDMRREAASSRESQPEQDNAFIANQLGDDSVNSAPTIRLVNSFIERAVTERASDIHIEPHETELLVRMRIDGIMRDIMTVPRDLQSSVISRVKIMAGLDITERRVPQDGRFNVRIRDKSIDLRVSTLPTVFGEKIVARLLDKSGGHVSMDGLGLTEEEVAPIKQLLNSRSGVILMVGPTGSGKTTTMYGMINELNRREVNLVTLEDPVEYNVEGVNQVQIN